MSDTDSVNSFSSWVSNLTSCEPLEKVLSTFNGNSKFQRKVLEMVTSLKNSIIKNGGTETSTEFYAALIGFLNITEIDMDTMEACIYILKHLMRQHIPVSVLRHTTSDLSKIILNLLSNAFGKNEIIVTASLFILSKLITAQTDESWNLDNIKHLYRTLFSFTTDSRQNVNKAARKSVFLIFSAKTKVNGLLSKKHPLNKETMLILTNSMKSQNILNKNRNNMDIRIKLSPEDDRLSFSLTTLSLLLKSKVFTTDSIVQYLEALIQCLLSLQIAPIQCQILNILSKLFVERVLFPEQIARCITSLFTYLNFCSGKNYVKNSSTPIPPGFIGTLWLNTILMGFESILLNDQETFLDSTSGQVVNCRIVALTHATNLIKFCSDWLTSDDETFKKSVCQILTKLYSGSLVTIEFKIDCLDPNIHTDSDLWLTKWAQTLCHMLLVQNTELSTRVIDNLVLLINRSQGKCEKFIETILAIVPQLAEMRDLCEDTEEEALSSLMQNKLRNVKKTLSQSEKALQNSIESLVGHIIKLYGFNRLAPVTPLADILDLNMNLLSTRSWIVPLIKMYSQGTNLDYFRLLILPCIQLVTRKIDSLSGISDDQMEVDTTSVAVVTLGTLRYQLWSCLPSFGRSVVPGGLREVSSKIFEPNQFPNPLMGGSNVTLWDLIVTELLSNGSNLEVIAMTTIRNIVKTAQDPEEMKQVMTSSDLFPRLVQNLFTVYMRQEHQVNIKSTLATYLPLFDPKTFDPNCQFLMKSKLSNLDLEHPTPAQLSCMDLLIILAPHLTFDTINTATEFMSAFLDNERASNQIHKRVYRFLELITASNTETSNEFSKSNLHTILGRLKSWTKVKADSWKCRMKSLYNLFKLMNGPQEVSEFLNEFLSEIITCLNMTNKKTRAVSGLILVEAILASNEESISGSIDRMVRQIVDAIHARLEDNSSLAVQYKSALAKALYLVLSENRLSRSVCREHITSALTVVNDIFSNHKSEATDRHLVYCALDILSGLLKKKNANFNNIYLVEVGQCLCSASNELRQQVRQPVKKILKMMLKLWDYEAIKKCIPGELIPVVRNIHKAMNRSKRKSGVEENVDDNESFATSWGGVSETGSQTMKNPHIKNIVELLEDTDSEDDDLKTQMTTKSSATVKSTKSKASQLRTLRKRKIDSANATLRLEENVDDIVDFSDPSHLVSHLRISDRNQDTKEEPKSNAKVIDKRGFHIEGGRLIIGKPVDTKESESKPDDDNDDSENDHYKSEKDRFQPVRKRMRKEKTPGSEYKSRQKGTFGDMKRKDRPDPYAYIPFKSADQCHNIMKKYQKETKKAHKDARKMSDLRKKKSVKVRKNEK